MCHSGQAQEASTASLSAERPPVYLPRMLERLEAVTYKGLNEHFGSRRPVHTRGYQTRREHQSASGVGIGQIRVD